tara:strand:- start:109 stop:510 length:402 start_codon:yes stop_codon:yes gene_type:complete
MISIPVSVGEVVDKITILRIKQRMISDQVALGHVTRELDLLLRAVRAYDGFSIGIDLESRLHEVNQQLWTVEDDLREKERLSQFDDQFIRLARSVYILNDERAALKRQINQLAGSALVEVKSYKDYGITVIPG